MTLTKEEIPVVARPPRKVDSQALEKLTDDIHNKLVDHLNGVTFRQETICHVRIGLILYLINLRCKSTALRNRYLSERFSYFNKQDIEAYVSIGDAFFIDETIKHVVEACPGYDKIVPYSKMRDVWSIGSQLDWLKKHQNLSFDYPGAILKHFKAGKSLHIVHPKAPPKEPVVDPDDTPQERDRVSLSSSATREREKSITETPVHDISVVVDKETEIATELMKQLVSKANERIADIETGFTNLEKKCSRAKWPPEWIDQLRLVLKRYCNVFSRI